MKALVVKLDTTVSDIKIAFSSSTDYTAEFTVEDSETVEANKITSEDFEFANNSLTAKTTLVDKVRKLDSSSKTVEKTIKINFTFKAKDITLKNNTKTLSIEVKLRKELAFKLSDIAGKWTATKTTANTLTITDGTIKAEINSTVITFTIENWDTKKNEEVQKYTTSVSKKDTSPTYDATLTFKSASSCDVSVKFGDGGSGDETFTKEATAAAK